RQEEPAGFATRLVMSKILRFTKMHGLGNDFIVLDGVRQRCDLSRDELRLLADRHFGVGCDQVLVVEAPTRTDVDFRYRIFNAEGGEVEQCGNGARCFVQFVRARGLTSKRTIRVETLGGIIEPAPVATEGPQIERHPRFPQGVNAGYVQVLDRANIRLRVWERGAGETLACGTGACAALVTGMRRGLLDSPVRVMTRGGPLLVAWQSPAGNVRMTGPAVTVFEGEWKRPGE